MTNDILLNLLPDLLATAALFTLSIYHLMIYWGRKKDVEEKYNLYFAIFIVAVSLFIVAPYFHAQNIFHSVKPAWLLVINIEALLMVGLFFSGLKFLNCLLKVPQSLSNYFYFTYITIPINFLLTLTSNFISLEFYFFNILKYVLGIIVINVVLVYSVYGIWIYRQRLYKKGFFIILYLGFILLTANILIYRSIELLNIPTILTFNHYLSAIILYVFAYALSVKFNIEYFELKELKINLETKVIERTEDLRKANTLLEERNSEIEKQKEEIVTINDQLMDRAKKLSELDEAKSRFFTGISHEFRTPLTLIIGPLETLLPHTKDEKIKAEYNLMLRQAKRLLELINQLLELSKLQKGMMVLNIAQGNFNRFIRTIVSAYSSLANELGIQLYFLEEIKEVTYDFDKDKIEKIVTNLITNALKFTPRGGEVEIILSQSQDHRFIEVIVRDSGIGIEDIKLKNIFNPFYQIDHTVKHGFEGSGIGLALVKELVELHRGSITVQSKVNNGTVFKVQLPLENILHQSIEKGIKEVLNEENLIVFNEEFSFKKNPSGKTIILLVEDNADMRYFIQSNLPQEYNVVEAKNGQEGLDRANELMPDLIITDIMMPVMNGLEMTQKLKLDERISHIPVIILTAKASPESKIEGLQTLADDYITKPFSVAELTIRIQNLIATRKRLKEKFSKSIIINPSEIVTTSIDENFLQKALRAVERNMDASEFNAELFCEEIGMSRAHVHRKLKALTDQSATQFIRCIRLKRAAQLLKQKSGSVSEIAYKTGFNNLSYFTRSFKEEFGVLPSEYNSEKE